MLTATSARMASMIGSNIRAKYSYAHVERQVFVDGRGSFGQNKNALQKV